MDENTRACMHDSISFFTRMSRVMQQCADSVLSTQPKCRYQILHRLAAVIEACGKDGSIYVSDLANTLYSTPQGVSRGLRLLEQDGLVERCTDPADRRKTMVRLTTLGQESHDACEMAMQAYGAAVAARLGPERVQRMHEDFNALLAAMEEEAQERKNL